MGQYSRLVCIFNNKDQADEFCKALNTPSHTKYTGSYVEARAIKMIYEIRDAIDAVNNGEILV